MWHSVFSSQVTRHSVLAWMNSSFDPQITSTSEVKVELELAWEQDQTSNMLLKPLALWCKILHILHVVSRCENLNYVKKIGENSTRKTL